MLLSNQLFFQIIDVVCSEISFYAIVKPRTNFDDTYFFTYLHILIKSIPIDFLKKNHKFSGPLWESQSSHSDGLCVADLPLDYVRFVVNTLVSLKSPYLPQLQHASNDTNFAETTMNVEFDEKSYHDWKKAPDGIEKIVKSSSHSPS